MFPPPRKLSSPEIQALRAKAARGDSLSLEETASFVLSYRASFLALPPPKEKGKKKGKGEPLPGSESPNQEIDFF